MVILTSKFFTLCVIALHLVITVNGEINVYNHDKEKVASFKDKEAEIGEILIQPIQGWIENAKPADACDKISGPTVFSNFSVGKFILINGTDKCSYMQKVKNAHRAGFDIAVVFDPYPKPYKDNHSIPFPKPQMKIPLIFISYKDGVVIRDRYLYNKRFQYSYILEILPNNPHISYNLMITLVVLAVLSVIILIILSLVLIRYIRRRKSEFIRRGTIIYGTYSKEHRWDVCAICTDEYRHGDQIIILPCQHSYCQRCIERWLSSGKTTCPLCKEEVRYKPKKQLETINENTPLINSSVVNGQPMQTSPLHPLSYPSTFPQNITTSFNQLSSDTSPNYSVNCYSSENHRRVTQALVFDSNQASTSRQADITDAQIRSLAGRNLDHYYLNNHDSYPTFN